MSDFSDRPFVAGTLTGLRSFKVDTLGRLTGVSQSRSVWCPGENGATCHASSGLSTYPYSGGYVTIRQGYTYDVDPQTGSVTVRQGDPAPVSLVKHRVAQLDCQCGYYAYFDREANPYHREGQIVGLIEGYGRVTVGSRGFRAEKARLLAFIGGPGSKPTVPWVKRVKLIGWIMAALLLFNAGFGATEMLARAWWVGSFNAAVAVVVLASLLLSRRGFYVTQLPETGSDIPDAVRRNYPDVPIFPTLDEAVATHPLTPPAPPTPETDAEFWTRPVSA